MVDSLTFSSAAALAATAAPVTTASPALDFASPPPAAALAASGVIAATVAGIEAGILRLNTTFGAIALKTNLILPPGAAVEVTIVPGAQPGANLLYTPGSPLATLASRPAPTSDAATPAIPGEPGEVVEFGQAVQATVVAASARADAMAAGSELTVRVNLFAVTPAIPASAIILATVSGSNGNTTLLNTPIGRLALDATLNLAPGTLLYLNRLNDGAPASRATASAASPGLGGGWPSLDEALATLAQIAPDLASRLRADLTPSTTPRMAAMLLFLVGALKGAGVTPPETAALALTLAGRGDLGDRLRKDMSDLRRLAANDDNADWRVFTLPILDESAVRPIRLYLRRRDDAESPDQREAGGTRFVLDLDMSRLGALQLDGLVRRGRFDLLLRSHQTLPADVASEITAIFRKALEGAGLQGNLSFTATAQFPVAPLDARRPHLGIEI